MSTSELFTSTLKQEEAFYTHKLNGKRQHQVAVLRCRMIKSDGDVTKGYTQYQQSHHPANSSGHGYQLLVFLPSYERLCRVSYASHHVHVHVFFEHTCIVIHIMSEH